MNQTPTMKDTNQTKKITIKSEQLQYSFKLFRVKVENEDINLVKDYIIEKMNSYLQQNKGKLMQCKIIKNDELSVYFVTEYDKDNMNWEEQIQNLFNGELKFYSQVIEIKPYM